MSRRRPGCRAASSMHARSRSGRGESERRRNAGPTAAACAAETLCCLGAALEGLSHCRPAFRSPAGEIDLIVRRGSVVAAVEVKARADHVRAGESVLGRQRARIVRALEHFLAIHPGLRDSICASTSCWWRPATGRAICPDAWRPGGIAAQRPRVLPDSQLASIVPQNPGLGYRRRIAPWRPISVVHPRVFAPLVLPLLLSGCLLPLAAAGAGASIGYVATEDRSMRENVDDAVLYATINKAWVNYNSALNDDLDCHAYQARVLVTGRVPSKAWREEAIAAPTRSRASRRSMTRSRSARASGFANNVHDGYITQQLKAELLADSDVHSNNYIVTTTNGVVFIIGTARDQAEIDRVVDHARNIDEVKRIVSYIRIRAAAGEARPGRDARRRHPRRAAPSPARRRRAARSW